MAHILTLMPPAAPRLRAHGGLGNRLGNRFVTIVGCGLPIASFLLTIKCFLDLQAAGGTPLIETAYTWDGSATARSTSPCTSTAFPR